MRLPHLVEYIQFGIFAIVPGVSTDQAVASKQLNSHSLVDICSVV